MCGFLGIYPAHSVSDSIFSEALDLMRHRGPDHKGVAEVNHLALGHARLSIVDLDDRSNQPMCDADRSVWIVFNGEIYNFLDLRSQLESGYKFVTKSDTEVILAAYLKWGREVFKRLNGMFALAIYDLKQNELLLARDQIGKKPLYYVLDRSVIAFGSEVGSIRSIIGNHKEIDESALNNYLARGFTGARQSIFTKIKKLPAGSLLRVQLSNLDSVEEPLKFWKLPVTPEAERVLPEPILLERIDTMLQCATISRLVADVPVGCFLSGGLDSSLVTAVAARNSAGKLKTFTVVFPGSPVDERKYAKEVSDYLGTDHHELYVGDHLIDEIPELIKRLDEPFADSSFVPTYFVCREARREVTVCLSGDGGDELAAGYGHYDAFAREMRLRNDLPPWMVRGIGKVAGFLPERHKTRSFKRLVEDNPIDGFVSYYTNFFSYRERGRLLSSSQFSAVRDPEDEIFSFYRDDLSWVENTCQADFRSYLVDDILVKIDRMSMLNSLEVRSPLLDREIAELFFTQIPSKYKRNQSTKKYILKQLGKRYLPESYQYERKQGFSVPLGDWFKGRLGDLLMDAIHSQNSGLFNTKYIYSLLKSHRLGLSNHSKRLFCVLVWEIWHGAKDSNSLKKIECH